MRPRRPWTLAAVAAGAAGSLAVTLAHGAVAVGRDGTDAPVGAELAAFGAPVTDGAIGPDAPGSFNATLPNGRRVTPAGTSVQVGQQPLNSVLTPDGKFLITSNDDERGGSGTGTTYAPQDTKNGAAQSRRGYSLAVVDTSTMKIVSALPVPKNATPHPGSTFNGRTDSDSTSALWLGLAIAPASGGGYTVYASGGPADVVYTMALGADGTAGTVHQISMPVPTQASEATYGMGAPGGMRFSPDGTTLWVAMNNGNSVVPVDVATQTAGTPVPVGYFPYDVQPVAGKVFVSNWGVTTRTFADGAGTANPTTGVVTHHGTSFLGGGAANRFDNPTTSALSSSLSVVDPASPGATGTIDLSRPIDGVDVVGGTHPSALAAVTVPGSAGGSSTSALYVADANEDAIAVVDPATNHLVQKVQLPSPGLPNLSGSADGDGQQASPTFGLMPDALAVSPDQHTLYVAEAGLNSVAVYDVSTPTDPHFRGRIPTGWWPSAVTVSPDGASLYVTNAKGAGSPYGFQGASGNGAPDDNYLFGSVEKVDLGSLDLVSSTHQVLTNTVRETNPDEDVLSTLQSTIKHVVFIMRENKSYDSYFGDDAVLNGRGANGYAPYASTFGSYVPNTRKLAEEFTVGDNNYADSEESNAGHQYALAGTSTDYSQKTLLSRFSRPLVNVKNEDPEDYPLQGYLFNAMARNGRSFRDYGDNIRISGYDEGGASAYCLDDPKPGCVSSSYNNIQDTTSPTAGLGGQYSETLPALKVLDGHLDESYPGWNLRISDQRRAAEFVKDFGHLVDAGTAPEFTSLWLPNDHTGGCSSNGVTCTPQQEVADNDAALGQVLDYLTHSPIWGSTAVFVTEDDTQGTADHAQAHRTYTEVISPYAKRGTVVHTLGSTVSVPKTIEEILDLPAMNYGDLLANDLLPYFTTTPDLTPYVPVGGSSYPTTSSSPAVQDANDAAVSAPAESLRIWSLVDRLDTSTYDVDSARVGHLTDLYERSLQLADRKGSLSASAYTAQQDALFAQAGRLVGSD